MRKLFLLLCLIIPLKSFANQDLIAEAWIQEYKHNLPTGLLVHICEVESHWRNGLYGANGEIGICQIKPATVRAYLPSVVHKATRYFMLGSHDSLPIQVVLASEGLYGGKLDGIYGKRTKAAVIEYQRNHELRVDGIVGPQTWKEMFNVAEYPHSSVEEQLKDPNQNIKIAAMYLQHLMKVLQTDNRMILAAAYNSGEGSSIVDYMLKVKALE